LDHLSSVMLNKEIMIGLEAVDRIISTVCEGKAEWWGLVSCSV
jgi:hypothetical protein